MLENTQEEGTQEEVTEQKKLGKKNLNTLSKSQEGFTYFVFIFFASLINEGKRKTSNEKIIC